MGESIQLLNRHGMKLWLGSLIGGLVVLIFLLIPHLFIGMVLRSEISALRGIIKDLASSPDRFQQLGTEAGRLLNLFHTGGTVVITYFALVLLITLLVHVFYTAGFVGSLRNAALEGSVSPGHFFSYGIRYMLRLLLLFLLQGVTVLVLAVPAAISILLVQGQPTWVMIAFSAVGGALLLLNSIAFSHSLIVMFAEEMGAFRSYAYGFKVIFVRLVPALVSILGSALFGVLGMAGVILLSLFPWLLLQIFDDGAVALLVGATFGAILFWLLVVFPPMLSFGLLFTRYFTHIQNRLFPEDDQEPVLVTPTIDDGEAGNRSG
ncbi:hypothetical protein [Paludifilum halophilum]|uniref:Glycerophosphoryl diester phosphodiesterase membrane domain-containing protein n=1 Tax=Paludifilum halophilum TaxID=1642702 RepID=A0A235B7X4_9BACL|nr:hypothetical protein [Paludifilum halophilum]OYD08332.1 hypothetical protein CHM34_05655 [Paludifilum halophilum]